MTQTASIRKSVPIAPSEPPRAQPGTIRLNAFQVLMRRWTAMAPYNAAQVMQVSGIPDLRLWQNAAETVLTELGLGIPLFSKRDAVVQFRPAPPVRITPASDLTTLLNLELNRRFAPDELPIRFFILQHDDGTHHFAAVYDHWIADSRAMRELMQRIFRHYQSPEGPQLPPLTLAAPSFYRLFRQYIGRLPRFSAGVQALFNIVRHIRACRINLPNPLDFNARVLTCRLPDGLIDRLRHHAKKHDASVNDVFLTALAQTMGLATAKTRYRKNRRFYRPRRDRIGLGTIVDIRDAASQPLSNVFGLYLSSFTVAIAEPEKQDFDSLLNQIARATRAIKQRRTAVRSFQAFVTALCFSDMFRSPRKKALFFQKTIPLAAGISNVNLTDSWADGNAGIQPAVLDYLRISPTGPLLPLVFTLTTIGPRLTLCVTYRTTAFTPERAESLICDFTQRLTQIL